MKTKQTAAKGKTDNKKVTIKNQEAMTKTTEKPQGKNALLEFEKKSYVMVPVNLIVIDEALNPRQDYGNIDELMLSIAENGLRNPVKGFQKDGQILLREGFRRMRAVNLALKKGFHIDRVPMILEERPMTEEERTLEFLINNDGKPFTMLEQAEVIKRLLNFGWKVTDIVKKTGKARGYIEYLIILTRIPMKVYNYIKEDKISAHAVLQIMIAEKEDAEKVISAVEKAIANAEKAGKQKATPKHIDEKDEEEEDSEEAEEVTEGKQPKGKSYGTFYKWIEEIADFLAGRKDLLP